MHLTVSITPPLESYVREKVESGVYASPSEVVRGALRLLQEHERRLRRDLQIGIDQADRGDLHPADFAAIKQRGRAESRP